MGAPQTLLDKVWARHVVAAMGDECLLYVDRNFVHEESSQAFEAVERAGRGLLRPDRNVAFCDHYVPTLARERGIAGVADEERREMIAGITRNAERHRLTCYGMDHPRQGIMHVAGAELGYVLPGLVVTGSDSHTCTHGAFGALAFGVGQSELRQVFLTQTVWRRKPRAMRVVLDGTLAPGVTAKDAILAVIAQIGASGGTGYALEYAGDCVAAMSMEARMTLANMSVEAGAQAGLVAPDETTYAYLAERVELPEGCAFEDAVRDWQALRSDPGTIHDAEVRFNAACIEPMVTWGTSLDEACAITGCVPDPARVADDGRRARMERALEYMGLVPGTALAGVPVDVVFIGSCSNARIEDLRAAAAVVKGRRARVPAVVSPGSRGVRRQAEREGLDAVFVAAGFEWRDSGCSMCVGSNGDTVAAGRRCASTSPRNFEGRQGRGARTHVMSPAMAAAAAVTGTITDVRDLMQETT